MNDDDESDYSDTPSIDSCEEYIRFESIRNPSTQLEEAISFSWPGIYEDEGDEDDGGGEEARRPRRVVVSTLLEEEDLAPLFDGSRWAGTRLWGAAVRGIQYVSGRLPGTEAGLADHGIRPPAGDGGGRATLLELGCGLGVPAMVYHMLGGNAVLTDQIDILSQLEKNVDANFPDTAVTSISRRRPSRSGGSTDDDRPAIHAMPLSWSRADVNRLLEQLGRSQIGFDIVMNCDCVYEPLYGKR